MSPKDKIVLEIAKSRSVDPTNPKENIDSEIHYPHQGQYTGQ